ncbi:MAG: GNAT family N-acetyltransferase [Deltaproteobacteria bacterium]|nr:GNAT family N-acetyltransferase [Deltaproteobacteria bacterium]
MKKTPSKDSQLTIRQAKIRDIHKIQKLIQQVYPKLATYPLSLIRGQINSFPEGHFVAQYDGEIIGYCASIRLSEKTVMASHTWKEITGGGYGTTHDQNGDYLYGYEIAVSPDYRGMKIGQRFYDERKKLCKFLRLKGIVFGGRLPKLKKSIKLKKVKSPEEYIEAVQARKIQDPVLYFQLRNGFEPIGILKNYLPSDESSLGYACHLIWKNPEFQIVKSESHKSLGNIDKIRLAAIQYEQRRIKSFEEFQQIVIYFVDVVSDYRCDFVLFPELFTLQLLSIENERIPPNQAVEKLCAYQGRLDDLFHNLAIKYNVNIIAGSHPVKDKEGTLFNTSGIYLRNGEKHTQSKIHPTPNEKFWWNMAGSNHLASIDTDCGPIGVLICYDSEFPELSRYLVDQGANIIFVPFLTDEKQSYNRVRYCAQARAVENQCYVTLAGNVGNLPRVENMDIHYAQSCILTPCDFNFSRDGIAADTTPNVETVVVADVSLKELMDARSTGTVQNLRDRRHDLYHIQWFKQV